MYLYDCMNSFCSFGLEDSHILNPHTDMLYNIHSIKMTVVNNDGILNESIH